MRESAWAGDTGRIGLSACSGIIEDPDALCFVAGPRAFVIVTTELLERAGIARSRIRSDLGGRASSL
jgi:hypothetical protein